MAAEKGLARMGRGALVGGFATYRLKAQLKSLASSVGAASVVPFCCHCAATPQGLALWTRDQGGRCPWHDTRIGPRPDPPAASGLHSHLVRFRVNAAVRNN